MAAEPGDIEYWNFIQIQKNMTRHWVTIMGNEIKFAENMRDFYLYRFDFAVGYKVTTSLLITANYKPLWLIVGDAWTRVDVPHCNVIADNRWHGIRLQVRNRMEYMNYTYKSKYWRYRGRIKMIPLRSWFTAPTSPFFAEEIFYDFNQSGFKFNRLYAGLRVKLGGYITTEIFYLLEHFKNENWFYHHVLGSSFFISY